MGAAVDLYPGTALLATLLGLHGYRKGSLSQSGALAAALLGYACLANPQRLFGVSMLTLYFVGSRATKYHAAVKSRFEDGHDADAAGGRRTAAQVACNAWLGVACSIIWRCLNSPPLQSTCPLAGSQDGLLSSRRLILTGVAFFAACLGDTLASELGILSRSKPRLATTLREVPPGTNGGVSLWGTACSVIGGTIVGMAAMISLRVNSDPSCGLQSELVVLASLAGLLGSAIDSILGATVQQTRLSRSTGKILTEDSARAAASADVIVIAGRPVLTNNQVNLVSSASAALLIGLLAG